MLRRHPTAGDDANMKVAHAEVADYFTTMKDKVSTILTDLMTQTNSIFVDVDSQIKTEAKIIAKTYQDNFSSTTLTCASGSESSFREAVRSSYVSLRSCAVTEVPTSSSTTREFTKTMTTFRSTIQTLLKEFRKCNAMKTDVAAIECALKNVYTIGYANQLTEFETKLASFNIEALVTCSNTAVTAALTKFTAVLTSIESCLQISTTAAPTDAPTTLMQ